MEELQLILWLIKHCHGTVNLGDTSNKINNFYVANILNPTGGSELAITCQGTAVRINNTNLLVNEIQSNTTNGNLTLVGNGTGYVVVSDKLAVNVTSVDSTTTDLQTSQTLSNRKIVLYNSTNNTHQFMV